MGSGYSGGRSLIRRDDVYGPGGLVETAGGGCCPPWDGVGSPASGQQVLMEYIADGDGSTTTFTTGYPYSAGSLRVYFNSVNKTYDKTEDDPTTGDFSVGTAPTASPLQVVFASYYAA